MRSEKQRRELAGGAAVVYPVTTLSALHRLEPGGSSPSPIGSRGRSGVRGWMAGVLVTGLALAAVPRASGVELAAVRVGSRIDVTVGGDFFTSYRFAADEKYPFLFPVNGPSGASVTAMRNGKYPHHSSVFFGCDQVNGGNYWQDTNEGGQILSTGAVIEQARGTRVVITDVCIWRRPGAEPPFRDTRRIVFSAPSSRWRQLDFEFTLEALVEVVIGKTNHSLFSVRLEPGLAPAQGGTLVNAEGKSGEQATFGAPSPWVACFGRRSSGEIEGVALLQHPANRWGRAPWFTRDYGFISPTPLYWPADGRETRIAKGERVSLRYRVLVFAGDSARADLDRHYTTYAATP